MNRGGVNQLIASGLTDIGGGRRFTINTCGLKTPPADAAGVFSMQQSDLLL
jgi:hypothetical protein